MKPPDARSPASALRRSGPALLLLAWGTQAIVTQSLLLREALVLMYGSEFAWGVVLFAWLFGVAIGGPVGSWIAARVRRADLSLVAVLMLLSGAACVELWVFRGARSWLGVQVGELLPLPKTALAAVLFISPASALVGMAFPLACAIRLPHGDDAPAAKRSGSARLGSVYAWESGGSLLGGAAFSFWAVDHLAPIETALLCAAVTAAASAGLLGATTRRATGPVCMSALALALTLTCLSGGDALNNRLVQRRWANVAPAYELCGEAESRYQNLMLGRRAGQYSLYCDGHVAADFPDPYSFVPLAHFWMCQHPSPKRALVLGGGAEGLLAEILRHPVEGVDYVEPDPRQLELIRPFLAEADQAALDDARVTVHNADARHYIKTQRARFDLVIARLPEPISALRARFFTAEFFAELRRAMTPRAVVCLTAAAAPADLPAATAEYVASVRATMRPHFPTVVIGWGNPAHVLAATEAGLIATAPAELTERFASRGIESKMFHPLWFEGATDWLEPAKVQARAAQLDAVASPAVSTDLHPVIYIQRLALWEQMAGGPSGSVVSLLRSARLSHLVGALAALGLVVLLGCRLRGRGASGWSDGALIVSIGSTGLATMALSIIWLFAFQHLYGYVYQRVGWIIALFMAGLVVGCALVNRRLHSAPGGRASPQHLWRRLMAVDVLLALVALSLPLLLPALGRMQSTPGTLTLVEWVVSIMVTLTGVLGGAAFALVGALRTSGTGDAAAAAGTIVGADHAGACLGALICGILLVPVFGTTTAALLLAGVKLASALILAVGSSVGRPGIAGPGRVT